MFLLRALHTAAMKLKKHFVSHITTKVIFEVAKVMGV